jgi:flagellar motor switch protein FliM
MAEEAQEPESQTLDQSEIDKLLANSAAQQPGRLVLRADGRRSDGPDSLAIKAFDFRNPAFLSEIDLRRLRLIHEGFVRYLSARLSLYLRMEFDAKILNFVPETYAKFTGDLPDLTHLCLFRVDPLVGVGILDINPHLALTIVDRILGGRGHSVSAERFPTEIEIGLLEDVIKIVLEEWCKQWKAESDLTPSIIGHENNGHFLETAPQDAVFLQLQLEVNFGDCSEKFQIGVPYNMIEPMVKRMQAKRQKGIGIGVAEKHAMWQKSYDRISVPVRAQWDAFEVSLREVTSFRVGDVLEMPSELFQRTHLLLNGVPKFIGTVGIDDDHVAVQLTAKLPNLDDE